MKDIEYEKLIELRNAGGGWVCVNENAENLLEQTHKGETVSFLEVTNRDLNFHRCYMALLNYVWGYMPPSFRKAVPQKNFYLFLKHLKGQYEVLYSFNDGTKLVQYESIAFGKMSQKRFEDYVREQLPWIYENVIHKYFQDDLYDSIVSNIEDEFQKFLAKL